MYCHSGGDDCIPGWGEVDASHTDDTTLGIAILNLEKFIRTRTMECEPEQWNVTQVLKMFKLLSCLGLKDQKGTLL